MMRPTMVWNMVPERARLSRKRKEGGEVRVVRMVERRVLRVVWRVRRMVERMMVMIERMEERMTGDVLEGPL